MVPLDVILVDPIFKEFYQALGGQDVLGVAVSYVVERAGRKCQYTEAAVMCFNPSGGENNHRYLLEPLGYELRVADDPLIPMPAGSDDRDLGGGFRLYHEFAALYDRIYGDMYAGRPLTQVRVNHALGRYEQFFENVGFYRNFNDPAGKARLLPYGAYLCGPDCSRDLDAYWEIVRAGHIAQPFELTLRQLGWSGLGRPVSQPRITGDGSVEQLYDNALLYAPADNVRDVHLRPLVLWMGTIAVQPLAEKNPHEQLVFYEVENGLGHNVPTFFDGFIAALGGREMAGRPVTELFPMENGLYRQCFEDYCLDYAPNAAADARVGMAALGWQYAQSVSPDMIAIRRFSPDTLAIELAEASPQIAAREQQRITVRVVSLPDRQPVPLATGYVAVNLPDRPALTFNFKPTDAQGQSEVTLPALDGLPSMSVIEYQACLSLPKDSGVCAVDSFVYRGE